MSFYDCQVSREIAAHDYPFDALGDRFWSKVQVTEGCWEWTAGRNANGYGVFWLDGKMHLAHRLSFGAAPGSPELDHLCRNRPCIRPDHLEPVSHKINMQRGHFGSKIECRWGHEYTEENTFITKATGARHCRICQNVQVYMAGVRRGERKSSKWDYEVSRRIIGNHPDANLESLIMAAMRKADTFNAQVLRVAFSDVWAEFQERYHAPGGYLPGENPQEEK